MQAMSMETLGARSAHELANAPAVRAAMLRAQCLAEQAFERPAARALVILRAVVCALLVAIAGISMYALATAGLARLDDPPRPMDARDFVVTTIEESGG